ncbi:MAG: hypothetical protein A3G33_02955 [Omnitrophica bacterium RIFCSPLOWO2_12_FULL_44_17]|uniref:FAD dependent oxidoreductase domain-containing protein n=1 Tax=Candidatus Danuiimicrobium aquiferis TaxID=1801832 RepID=A0A1G1KVG1_9BACT|nr:MAG: hypothetical protein A3B72_04435 [Omnitrophica bacterium RIFCSPHIGHO2_02_FULL_45_28]OGW90430.1 MAG: hypothetical protein A3E74_04250 [Omnitrophica bacterium RIFCSPHIGHO2_12_FULL_44_12]OGW96938.1 MAG: hypothetical protein A3G33_02955 [Omnitrophica bacterium RIFCSPLOWO2_12_FULL_44_17]OGX03926.1 MAG: hypothetical protein A3J12_03460 [Omnitrophica bacterium RIFCSPLOWO2_02_FULL_44_11]
MKEYDYLIVGAGIVGLAVARELKMREPKAHICVLEKEAKAGVHASGHNSGVLHCGIYYSSDSLKARVCATGARMMREFVESQNLPIRRSGKVIIATCEEELPILDKLMENAKNNDVCAELRAVKGIKEIEPNAEPYRAGIYSPDTAVVDSALVTQRLANVMSAQGVDIFYHERVKSINPECCEVKTENNVYHYSYLFNCAGAYADTIAKFFGLGKDYALVPFKGLYFKLRSEQAGLVNGNIYPVPDVRMPFLGVHLTKVVSGDVYVGPTAMPAFGREHYGFLKGMEIRESVLMFKHLADLYLKNAQSFRNLVHQSTVNYLKTFFVHSARKLVPKLTTGDLISSNKVGIRPQLINKAKKCLEMDYVIEEGANSLHVLNSISPAFTSAFAFAKVILDRRGGGNQ